MRSVHAIPVALDRLETPMCTADPEPKRNPDTGEICIDYRGRQIWTMPIAVRHTGTRNTRVIDVSTIAEPHGITRGTTLRIINLDAIPWTTPDGHFTEVSYIADQILPSDDPDWRTLDETPVPNFTSYHSHETTPGPDNSPEPPPHTRQLR
jgi:hypothetical protein